MDSRANRSRVAYVGNNRADAGRGDRFVIINRIHEWGARASCSYLSASLPKGDFLSCDHRDKDAAMSEQDARAPQND
jgi:hypothetical protein